MPIVRVELFPGRSAKVKAEIGLEIARVFERTNGLKLEDTTVIFSEVSQADWVVGGRPYGEKVE